MFVDAESDAVLIRDVFGPQCYCRACFHMTYLVDGDRCAWCKSTSTGIQPHLVMPRRAMGMIPEPEDRQPTKHQRLREGFARLHGEVTD
jgi:hypothetical protein